MGLGRGNRRPWTLGEVARGAGRKVLAFWDRVWRPVGFASLAVCIAIGALEGWRKLKESEHLVLRSLAVEGNRTLSDEDVTEVCGIAPGRTNLLFTNRESIRSACESDFRIRSAEVEIDLPDRATIRIEEQRTAFFLAVNTGLWEVNPYGEPFAPAEPLRWFDAPLVVGDDLAVEAGDPRFVVPPLKDVLALVRTVEASGSPWAGQSLELAYDPDLGLTVSSDGRGLKGHFGRGPFPRKLERLIAALDIAARKSLLAEEAFVDNAANPNKVTLKLALEGRIAKKTGALPEGARASKEDTDD
jgi:hypothetical protein